MEQGQVMLPDHEMQTGMFTIIEVQVLEIQLRQDRPDQHQRDGPAGDPKRRHHAGCHSFGRRQHPANGRADLGHSLHSHLMPRLPS